MLNTPKYSYSVSSLDTLAQSGTSLYQKSPVIVGGTGTDMLNTKALEGKTKRKYITQKIVLSLIDVAKAKSDDYMLNSYWNTYHCQSEIYSKDNRLYGNYCKNRFCTVCLANRKADIINKYLPYIQEHWNEPFFLTLTVKAVKAEQLHKRIYEMKKMFDKIIGKYRKRYQRGTDIKLYGIKSLECNYNPVNKTYNPHFHLILPNLKIGTTLKREWREYWNDPKIVTASAQMLKRVKDKEAALIEIIKYGSKIFTEPDIKQKGKQKGTPYIYVEALHNIFCVLRGQRIFDRFGFNLPIEYTVKQRKTKVINEYQTWEYQANICNWLSPETEELLSKYVLPKELEGLLENNRVTGFT